MVPSDIVTQARYLTKTTSSDGNLSDAQGLNILNDYYLRQAVAFVDTNEDKFGTKATTDLNIIANQEAYAFPSDLLRLKRAEITFDGSTWQKLHSADDGDFEGFPLDQTTINARFAQADPYIDILGDYFYLRPVPTASVTAGLRIWYIQRPSLLSTLSSSINTPLDYHGYLTYGLAGEIATRLGNETLAATMFQKWEDGLAKIEKYFSPLNEDQWVNMKTLPIRYT